MSRTLSFWVVATSALAAISGASALMASGTDAKLLGTSGVLLALVAGGLRFADWFSAGKSRKLDEFQKAELSHDTEVAGKRASEAAKLAESEKLARIKAEEERADRRLTEAQRATFVAALKPLHGQPVAIWYTSNGEPASFAKAIRSALREAGWTTSLLAATVDKPGRGLAVDFLEGSERGAEAALALVNALLDVGHSVCGPAMRLLGPLPAGDEQDDRINPELRVMIHPK